jgi:hypothetical protein
MKISEIIAAAYRKAGIAGYGQPLSAEQAAAGLEAFNLMLTAWVLDGIYAYAAPNNVPFATVTDFASTADFPLAPAFREGTVFCLASRIAPEFSAQGFDMESFMIKMRAAYMVIPTADMNLSLVRGAVYPRYTI